MQWILQEFDDTRKLGETLDRLDISFSWHQVVPFVGDLVPEPEIDNRNSIILFGSYTLWRYAEKHQLKPGVFKLNPFVHEEVWLDYMLNGKGAKFARLRDLPEAFGDDEGEYFMRPVEDSKEQAGKVRTASQIRELAHKVLKVDEVDIPSGSLRHDTLLMFTMPVQILKEWRIWIVDGKVVTWSLYKQGALVVYKPEADNGVLEFAQRLADLNPDYAMAYVMDICLTPEGLRLIETNCINAAGFYAADLQKLVMAIENLD